MNADSTALPVHDPFAGPDLAARLPLTESQREIWLATQLHPEAAVAYNEGLALTLTGELNVEALQAAVDQLVERHELLRAGVSPNGRWISVFAPRPLQLQVTDGDVHAIEMEEMSSPFDLERGPPMRFRLVRQSSQEHVLILVSHHIMVDGWSYATLLEDLGELYSARVTGRPPALGAPASFGDYVEAERAFLESEEGKRHADYWLRRLAGIPEIPQLPGDLAPPRQRSYAAGRVDLPLSPALLQSFKQLGARNGASLVASSLAALGALFLRSSNAGDLALGVSAAGQVFHQREGVVGHCVNLLPLRLQLNADASFAESLAQVSENLLDAFEHQGTTYGSLLPRLSLSRDGQRPPLIAAVFNLSVPEQLPYAGLQARVRTLHRQAVVFDWHFNLVADGASPRIECSYNADLYSPEMARARLQDLAGLMQAACEQPACKLGQLRVLSEGRLHQITRVWNDTAAPYALEKPLHQFIAEAAAERPHAPAVMDDDNTLSYLELEARADALAAVLRRYGAGRGTIVGVCARRCVNLPVALLAVLKAGAAYMPLDPEYPQQRLALMIEDAQCPVILTGSGLEAGLRQWLSRCGTPLLSIDETYPVPASRAPAAVEPDDLAYVIFTSGSTGRPKGAMLNHRGIVNRLLWMQQEYGIGPGDRVLQKTPFSFDVSVWEFFWPLMTGATLVVAQPEGHKNPAYVASVIEDKQISVCHFVPSMLGLFLTQPELRSCSSLRHVFASGEALSYALAQQFRDQLPDAELHNLYGPTEASVDVTYWRCVPDDARKRVPIGRPVANTQVYVLDDRLQPVSVGVAGQLYLGGVQLARGYLRRPELTAERFITHPQFGRLYLTGDSARWLPDGVVDYLGRLDGQVKLRGLRIELGEIEARLDALPQIAESACAVRARGAGDERLIAWVAPAANQRVQVAEILEALRQDLPEFMLPQHVVEIAALPRLTSGKIDRKALPEPSEITAPKRLRHPPATPAEKAVAAVWRNLLGVETVNRDDRFFDLGGHSLLAVQAVTLLRQRFGIKPSLRSVMMGTVAALAQELSGGHGATTAPETAKPAPAPAALTRQEAFYFGAAGQRLFGIITRPSLPRKSRALLICQSWGVEYMRSHRALQLFAQQLAELGFFVMRFDYYGTGDSAGDSVGAGVQSWVRNIRAATAELRSRTGLHQVSVIGVRLGALLAAAASASGRDASSLLLWDPPPSGAHWLAELKRLAHESHENWNRQRPRSTKLPPPPADQLFGMTVSADWLSDIDQLNPSYVAAHITVAQSRDEAAVPARDAILQLPDASCWSQLGWITRPWNPRASAELVAAHLEKTLP